MKNLICLFVIVLFVTCLPLRSSAQVDLPFDYLYGRWVDGHYLRANFYGYDLDIKLSRDNEYTFTQNKLQFNFSRFGNYILWDDATWDFGTEIISTPVFGVTYRKNNHWQLSLENIWFHKNRYSQQYSYFPELEQSHYEKAYNFDFKSKYAHKDKLSIANKHTPFSYIGQRLYRKGNCIIENEFSFRRTKDNYILSSIMDEVISTTESNYNIYTFHNQLQYGLTDDLNVLATLNHGVVSGKQTNNIISPSYSVSILSGNLAPLYLNVLVRQRFENRYNNELHQIFRYIQGNLTYLTRGKFQNEVILNNYNNYYRQMLFQHQYLFSIHTEVNRYNNLSNSSQDSKEYRLEMRTAFGLTSQFNIESEVFYKSSLSFNEDFEMQTYVIAQEQIYYSLKIRYLSYMFQDNAEVKWNTDSNFDILFGNVLQSKQYYVELEFTSPDYSNYQDSEIGLFEFKNLKSNSRYSFNVASQVGLGKKTEFTLKYEHMHSPQYEDRSILRFRLEKRVFKKIELSVLAKKYFDRYTINDFSIDGNIQIAI